MPIAVEPGTTSFTFAPQGIGLTNVTWLYSQDNGNSWDNIVPGTNTALPNGTGNILIKAIFSPGFYPESPVLNGFKVTFVSTGNGDSEDYFFTGKEKDVTGLYYFGARYYDPEIGRFISEDPGQDGVDWFGYCKNNPLGYFDPDGLAATPPDRGTWKPFEDLVLKLAELPKNTKLIVNRIPDGLKLTVDNIVERLVEAKNVKYLYYSTQLKDFIRIAQDRMELYINQSTRLSLPLLEALKEAGVKLYRIGPTGVRTAVNFFDEIAKKGKVLIPPIPYEIFKYKVYIDEKGNILMFYGSEAGII